MLALVNWSGGSVLVRVGVVVTRAEPSGRTATWWWYTRRMPWPFLAMYSNSELKEKTTPTRTYTERFSSVGSNPSPAQLRTVAQEGQTAITQAVAAAPAEIKPDVEVLARTFGNLITELERVNYDATRLPPGALQALQAPEFTQATTRFQAYSRSVCGIS